MNWGMKIIVGLGTFMLLVISAVVYMLSYDKDSLIDDNYYEKSLVYDNLYRQKQNVLNDNVKPQLLLKGDTLSIFFKGKVNKGELSFKRPSDGNLDLKIPFYTASNVFKLPVSTFVKGSWTLDVTWTNGENDYLYSQSLYLQ